MAFRIPPFPRPATRAALMPGAASRFQALINVLHGAPGFAAQQGFAPQPVFTGVPHGQTDGPANYHGPVSTPMPGAPPQMHPGAPGSGLGIPFDPGIPVGLAPPGGVPAQTPMGIPDMPDPGVFHQGPEGMLRGVQSSPDLFAAWLGAMQGQQAVTRGHQLASSEENRIKLWLLSQYLTPRPAPPPHRPLIRYE